MAESKQKSEKQKGAEADVERFRKLLGPFVGAAEATRMPMIFTDAKQRGNPIVFANPAFLALTGYDQKEVLGESFTSLMARGTDAATLAQVQDTFEGSSHSDMVIHYRRKDLSEFWASAFISPVKSDAGEVLQHFVSLIDLTKEKEDQSRAQLLIDELHHRVKNVLQAAQSIVYQAFRNASDPARVQESIESRLLALSRCHDLLMSENWESVGLTDLVETILEPFSEAKGRSARIAIMGPDIRLQPAAVLALGIAFHELAINAVKCGALSTDTGSIAVGWTIENMPSGKRLMLRWQEKGGPMVSPPIRKGFGSRMLEQGLSHEMNGTVRLDFQPNGLVCTMDIPAPRGGSDA